MLYRSMAKKQSADRMYQTITTLVAVAIFCIDTFTPLETAVAVLYAVVVSVSAGFLNRRGLLLVSGLCVILTVLSYAIVHGEMFQSGPFIRALISLCAIGVTTMLALNNQETMEQISHQASLLDLTHDAIIVRDMNGLIIFWNAGAEELYGWPREQVLGRNATELLKTEVPTGIDGVLAKLQKADRWEGELVHTKRDGTRVVVASRWSLYRDERGQPIATITINNDITEHKRAEDALNEVRTELSHVARISTLGELTASIAHEVNQPLAAVVTNGEACLRWLLRDSPDLKEVKLSVERMIANGRRASEVIARLRALSRKSRTSRSHFTMNDIVDDVLPLVEREFARQGIPVELYLSPSPLTLSGDRVQLQQVVINLLMNAVQSMAAIDNRQRRISIRSANGGDAASVWLEVTDSGVGIDADSASKLFMPFYTTKPDGMGMGLSICRSIVEAHGGQISAASAEQHGAVFSINLPVRYEAYA